MLKNQNRVESKNKALQALNPETGETLKFKSALEAKLSGFDNSNISKAIKQQRSYKGYIWSFVTKLGVIDTNKYLVFEHEIKDPVKSKIWKSIMSTNKTRIFARDCIIKDISNPEHKVFLVENHLQGFVAAKVKIGLYYNNELVAIMTFGKPRFNKEYEWELLRFCSKLDTQVIGGASKLLAYFKRQHNPANLISYANKRFSVGKLYEALGFEAKGETSNNYWYIKGNQILNRITCQKHKLSKLLAEFNPDISETANMLNNGYKKLKDRGNLVYTLTY